MNTNETREYKQLVNLLYAANAQAQQLRRARNQARTALRDDIAILILKPTFCTTLLSTSGVRREMLQNSSPRI